MSQLSQQSDLFSFLYNISIIEDDDEILKHCEDLKLALSMVNYKILVL